MITVFLQVFNLSSCRDVKSQVFSCVVPGSLAVIIVPPTLIPITGFFPNSIASILAPSTAPSASDLQVNALDSEASTKAPNGTENSQKVKLVQGPKKPRILSSEFLHTNPAFIHGSLKDAVPISCLLTKTGALLPYIGQDEAAGLVRVC